MVRKMNGARPLRQSADSQLLRFSRYCDSGQQRLMRRTSCTTTVMQTSYKDVMWISANTTWKGARKDGGRIRSKVARELAEKHEKRCGLCLWARCQTLLVDKSFVPSSFTLVRSLPYIRLPVQDRPTNRTRPHKVQRYICRGCCIVPLSRY